MTLPRSLRTLRVRFLLVVLCSVLVPLSLTGLWLSRSAARSGEELLRTRLDDALNGIAVDAGTRWVVVRSQLLNVADESVVQHAFHVSYAPNQSASLQSTALSSASFDITNVSLVRQTDGRQFRVESAQVDSTAPRVLYPGSAGPARAQLSVTLPVHASADGRLLGRLDAKLALDRLVTRDAGGVGGVGAVLQVIDRSTGASLTPLPFDARLLRNPRFVLSGAPWVVQRRTLQEPGLVLIAAAPLASYALPFERAARKGSLAILLVAFASLGAATLLTRRLTLSLEELATATHAVAGGKLDQRVSDNSDDEVGRVGRAFNAMTDSLQRMMRQLSQRESLAAVGEFAASLAHEVRNPLTSIRIDLQRVDEQLPADSPFRVQLSRALREVERLDRTVSGALRVARSGRIASDTVDLRAPLERAIEVATPAFTQAGASLAQIHIGSEPIPIRGDEAALEQLFLNVLLNAAQALATGGQAGVSTRSVPRGVEVDVWDSGVGIAEDQLGRIFDPFYSTKSDGTGLGLSIARQIATAHGGSITIESSAGRGTTVTVKLVQFS